jgi:hypothetical protein
MGAAALSPIIGAGLALSEETVSERKNPHKPKTPPMKIPLPFEKTVEGLLATKPRAKKRPVAKKATGSKVKRKK